MSLDQKTILFNIGINVPGAAGTAGMFLITNADFIMKVGLFVLTAIAQVYTIINIRKQLKKRK